MNKSEGEGVLLLPVNLDIGEFLVIRWRCEGGSGRAADKKPALWVIFPSRSIYSRLHLNPTEAVSLLQRPHLMQLTKECDCTAMPVLTLHCNQSLHRGSSQRTADTV